MSNIEFTITPKELLDMLSITYKVRNYNWLGYKLCPVCGGGESGQDKWTFAVHKDDGNFNCLRDSCDTKGSFWGLMLFYHINPKQYIKKDTGNKSSHGKRKRFVYGKS